MRFKADLTEGAVETVRRLVVFMSRLNKKRCIIRITPTEFILLNDSSTSRSYWIEAKIKQEETFGEFELHGLSKKHNEIFMDLSASDLSQALSGVDSTIKMRLTKDGTMPHLSVKTDNVNNSIPVTMLMSRQWSEYQRNVDPEELYIGIYLPNLKLLQKILSSVKNTQAKHVMLAAKFSGELQIVSRTDTARVMVCLSDLTAERYPLTRDVDDRMAVKTVLDCKNLHQFITNIPNCYTY
uniref:Checkpoint protein n=1 Tax=Steinernema glaseri TaxID=37863 RepID=A0A1I7Y8I4_9BILA